MRLFQENSEYFFVHVNSLVESMSPARKLLNLAPAKSIMHVPQTIVGQFMEYAK